MPSKILTAVLILILTGLTASAFQNADRRPTPRPAASTRPTPRPAATTKPSAGQPVNKKTSATTAKSKEADVSLAGLVFTWPALIFLFVAGVVAFGLGAGIGAASLGDNQAGASLRGLEALLLAVIGGLLARLFVALLLSWGGDSPAAHIAVGWGFFIVPGAVDTIAWLATGEVATSADFLVWMATAVGAFTGLMNGFWRIHDWKGVGWLAFPLDVTWGLAGATTGSLLHLINFAWAGHADETRYDAHRYLSGARLKSNPTPFALTQGPVMSSLRDGPGIPLYHHERTHVWQNRVFGPLFSLSYLGWMALWVIPAAIAAIVTKDKEAFDSWCYFNNPWETWAYLVGAGPRTGPGRPKLVWGDLVILLLSIPFFGGFISLFIWIVLQVW
ncbi:MAG: hypothetical protein ACRD6N_00905 [Pyrinomonadaceae bacterium]